MRVRFFLFYVVFLGYVGSTPSTHAQSTPFPHTVIDDTGRPVTVAARPQQVAVVGDDPILPLLLEPTALAAIPLSTPPTGIAWEHVGLFVLSDFYATAYPALVESAAAQGVPVYRTTPPDGLAEWRDRVARLSRITGRDARGEAVLARLDGRTRTLNACTQNDDPVRVLILTPERYTFGQPTLITDLISAAGGINVTAEAGFDDFRQIDEATIRTLAPDALLLTPTWSDDDRRTLLDSPTLAGIPAIAGQRVFTLPVSPTRIPDPAAAILGLAVALHPHVLLDLVAGCGA